MPAQCGMYGTVLAGVIVLIVSVAAVIVRR